MVANISRSLGQVTTTTKGTSAFWAPELWKGQGTVRQSKESDVWAFGMTIYVCYTQLHSLKSSQRITKELVFRQRPFAGLNDFQVLQAVTQGKTPPVTPHPKNAPNTMRTTLERICRQCWASNSTRRPTMRNIVGYLRPEIWLLHEEQGSKSLGRKVGFSNPEGEL